MKDQELNVFGEPDDIKQALYSSWVEFEEALRMIQRQQASMKYDYADEITQEDFLVLLANKLNDARESINLFAPNYHRDTLEGWAQGAAEMSHP